MKSNPSSEACADKLKVLSDGTRLAVMEVLLGGPQTVSQLKARLKIDQSLLSHHLKVLRDAALVLPVRQGKSIRYEIAQDVAREVAGKGLNLGCCQISFAPVTFGKKNGKS